MIETYAFLFMFGMQILTMSVRYPTWFIRYLRLRSANIPAEQPAQLYPGIDSCFAQERFLSRYRGLNSGIAVIGLFLLGRLFTYMRRSDWHVGYVEASVALYFVVQTLLPLCLLVWRGVRIKKVHKGEGSLLESKHKVVLQRHVLFDFVSPLTVVLAVLSYLVFAAFMFYIQRQPFRGLIGGVTLVYLLQAYVVYAVLHGKKSNQYETDAGRVRTIGLVVKSCVYSCIVCVAFVSLNFTLGLLDQQRWGPCALSVFFVISALLSLMGMTARPSHLEAEGFSSRS